MDTNKAAPARSKIETEYNSVFFNFALILKLLTQTLIKYNAAILGKKFLIKTSDAGAKANCYSSCFNDLYFYYSTLLIVPSATATNFSLCSSKT